MAQNLSELLDIKYPIIMAPMFLVSNTKMVIEALNAGITAAIPAMNYKSLNALKASVAEIREATKKPFGINLIANKSNPQFKQQLDCLCDLKVDFIITSLGNPKKVIEKCNPLGIKVFCDVVNLAVAKKVEMLGADAIIAVNNKAGGHSGSLPQEELITLLKQNCSIPIISAGGVANKNQLKEVLSLGADGVSIGSIFIASHECEVLPEYKEAIVKYGAKDIVMTTKMSGSPLSVINTPYVKQIGTKANLLERIFNRNKRLKKFAKMLLFNQGMKTMEKAAFKATYKTVWVAGVSIEQVNSTRSIKEIIKSIVND